ncbi:TPR-like protein [Serendipita vermifera]|nr:TPR-like protein [Serendipita vermifera]
MSSLPVDPLSKIETAKEKKNAADAAFKAGDIQKALLNYHEALMYLQGIDKNLLSAMRDNNNTQSHPDTVSDEGVEASIKSPGASNDDKDAEKKELSEVDDLLSKIYSNQSACHMKRNNWKRAKETADQALAKNPNNTKAKFRKGKAMGEMGYVERALEILEELLKKDDGSEKAMITAEIARIKAADKERERKHNQKFKGFLNKKPATTDSNTSVASTVSMASTAGPAADASKSTSKKDEPKATPLEPSGLVEVSEEEFERAKKANASR